MNDSQTTSGAGPAHLHRIALFGAPATGKTTLARWLSTRFHVPYTELDNILFTPLGSLPLEEFRRQTAAITATGGWIVEGNFSKLADIVWHRADLLIWLDFPLPLILYRITRRSLRHLTGREDTPQARPLTWSTAFFARRSLLRTAIRKHRTNRPRYARQAAETAALGVTVVRLRSPRQVHRWKQQVADRQTTPGTPDAPTYPLSLRPATAPLLPGPARPAEGRHVQPPETYLVPEAASKPGERISPLRYEQQHSIQDGEAAGAAGACCAERRADGRPVPGAGLGRG
nr:hypothetical protein [Streptomyces sp. WAC04770]